jgi:hypothetical protein
MHFFSRVALAAALVVAGSTAFAAGRVQSVPRTTPNPNRISAFGLPKPSGLTSSFPAGLNEGSGAAVSTDRVASGNAPMPVDTAVNGNLVSDTTTGITTPGSTTGGNGFSGNGFNANGEATNTTAVATTVLGAGPGVPGPSQNVNAGAGGYSATDVARWFFFADSNHDGELTRAEYSRLPVKPLSFEQMDRNFDGVISRFEYDDAFR